MTTRRLLAIEVAVVLAVTVGRNAVYSALSLIDDLTKPGPLRAQSVGLNVSQTPDRSWLDLTYQLVNNAVPLAGVALVIYLLVRSADSPRDVLVGRGRHGRDLARGAVIAAGVGTIGAAFYVASHELGFSATVVADSLPDVWWHYPVLVLSAARNAVVEEVIVVGYLLHRMRQLGVGDRAALGVSAVVRGAYHLYQGFGGFVANAVMGVLFGWLYHRWGRVTPLVVAHTLLDVGAFVGYALLAPHFAFLRG